MNRESDSNRLYSLVRHIEKQVCKGIIVVDDM
jgi:hypothetical protein